jgi:small-conductance mechanosensitive channel
VVAISNKATFTEPVFNFSAPFEYIWEELTFPVAYSGDWRRAEAILDEEARRLSADSGAQAAIDQMAERYPVPRAEVQPRVYARSTDNYLELAVRFVVPVHTARSAKDDVTRRILSRFASADIEVASTSLDINVRDH